MHAVVAKLGPDHALPGVESERVYLFADQSAAQAWQFARLVEADRAVRSELRAEAIEAFCEDLLWWELFECYEVASQLPLSLNPSAP